MAGGGISVKTVLSDDQTPILPNIGGEPTREELIYLHQLISGNVESMASNLIGSHHGHFDMTMTADEYKTQTEFAFVPPHNPGNYLQIMGNTQ